MSWGGARIGAGRRAKGPRPSEPHKRRPYLSAHQPIHVTARITRELALSRGDRYRRLQRPLSLALRRADFRIVHLAVMRDRLELLVEAVDKQALAKGMQGFQVSAARALNRQARRA